MGRPSARHCRSAVEPRASARGAARRLGRLVDPGAAVVAIDADRREIDDRLQPPRRENRAREAREHGILGAGRDRDQQRLGRRQPGRQRGVGAPAVEDEGLDPVGGERLRLLRLAHRAARRDAFLQAQEMQRAE